MVILGGIVGGYEYGMRVKTVRWGCCVDMWSSTSNVNKRSGVNMCIFIYLYMYVYISSYI